MHEWIEKTSKFMNYLEEIKAFEDGGYVEEKDKKKIEKDFIKACRDYPELTSLIITLLDK